VVALNDKVIALILGALLLLATTDAGAVDVSAQLDASTIRIDEQVTLTIRVTESRIQGEPQFPSLDAFTIYSAGQTFSSTIVNGKMASSVEYRYILVPRKTGKFQIPPITVNVRGKEYKTEPLTIQVEAASSQGQMPGQSGGRHASETENKDYLISASISKDTVYEGEQLVHNFKAYQRSGAAFFSDPVYLPPSYSGFVREEFGWKRYNRIYQGDVYVINEMNSYLFPVTPGESVIEPTRVVVTLDNFSNLFNFDPFDSRSLRSRTRRGSQSDTLYTEPLNLTVLPLPREGRPRDFKGSVGHFNMNISLSGTEATVDETILLTVKISGRGDINSISPPEIPEIEGLDIRPSGDTTVINEAAGQVAGSKTFEFSIIPEEDGFYEFPRLSWSYFDPETKSYRTHRSQVYEINISPGANVSAGILPGITNIQGVLKARDILSVMPLKDELKPSERPLIYKTEFITLQTLPLLLLAGVILFRRRQDRLLGDVRYRRLKRAHGMAKKQLGQARKLLGEKHYDEFFGAVSKALYDYVGDKFNYSASGLTEIQVRELLEKHGHSTELMAAFGDLIQSTDFGRFAPGQSSSENAHKVMEEAEKWIVAFEQEGKKTR
jgi:hypothetical protein